MRSLFLVVLVVLPAIALANQYQQTQNRQPPPPPPRPVGHQGGRPQGGPGYGGQRVDPIRPVPINQGPIRNTKPGPGYHPQPIQTGGRPGGYGPNSGGQVPQRPYPTQRPYQPPRQQPVDHSGYRG